MAYERNETIEELEELIRNKKDKLERSEAHSNIRSTKTKTLKESQLKASIHESEARLQAALESRAEQVESEVATEQVEPEMVSEPEEEVLAPQEQEVAEEATVVSEGNQETIEEVEETIVENVPEPQEPSPVDVVRDEVGDYRRAANTGRRWHPNDRNKSIEGIRQLLTEEYDKLDNKQTRSGTRVLSIDEEREVFKSQEKTETFGSGFLVRGEVNEGAKRSLERANKSENLGYERNVGNWIDDKIKQVYDNISTNDKASPEGIKRATEIFCRIEVVNEHHQQIKQKQQDLILHEEYIGPFVNSKKETSQVRKPGIAGIFGAKEEVTRNVPLTNEEMFDRKHDAQNTINGLLENNEISQQGFDKVSESLDRLYGNEPQPVSDMDLQIAKEEAGIFEPEPVVYETTNEVVNETTNDQDMGYGYDDQPSLTPPSGNEMD